MTTTAYIIEVTTQTGATLFVTKAMQDGTILHTNKRSEAGRYSRKSVAEKIAEVGNARGQSTYRVEDEAETGRTSAAAADRLANGGWGGRRNGV